jgi:hypothetical protein
MAKPPRDWYLPEPPLGVTLHKQALGTKKLSGQAEYMIFGHLEMNDAH